MDGPSYLSESEIVELHDRIIGLVGGMPGLRDAGALSSCVAQPQTRVFGVERFPSPFDKAAAYLFFISQMQPFMDGNKRTGLSVACHFLLQNGTTPLLDEEEAYQVIIAAAQGEAEVEDLSLLFQRACASTPNELD